VKVEVGHAPPGGKSWSIIAVRIIIPASHVRRSSSLSYYQAVKERRVLRSVWLNAQNTAMPCSAQQGYHDLMQASITLLSSLQAVCCWELYLRTCMRSPQGLDTSHSVCVREVNRCLRGVSVRTRVGHESWASAM
jgi:hypothetical protein